MSQSVDPGHFFQTDASQSTQARKAEKSKNTHGNPITLPSKILAVVPDPTGARAVYVAESAGLLRRVDLSERARATPQQISGRSSDEEGKHRAKGEDERGLFTREVYRGATAPLTCIAFSHDAKQIYAGCWDKAIWSWERGSAKLKPRLEGHADFVKCLVVARVRGPDAQAVELLVSGGQDGKIIVWDALSGGKLHVLTGHARGVLSLAVVPSSSDELAESVQVYSGDSAREIRRWRIGVDEAKELVLERSAEPILLHETSVNHLHFTDEEESGLWTASSDNTAKRSLFNAKTQKWEVDTTLTHPDFVRAVLPLHESSLVATACRDEEIRIWDADTEKLFDSFTGHFEEVTGLALVGDELVSVSIDATVRVWPATKTGILGKLAAEQRAREAIEADLPEKGVQLDEDEERELAELMEDDD